MAEEGSASVHIWRDVDDVPDDVGPTVVVVGNFDGVHRGHLLVIARAHQAAVRLGDLPVVAATFEPHPMAVLRPGSAPRALGCLEHRAELLAAEGVAGVFVIAFDRDVAAWSPQEFVERILVETLHAAAVVVGANFRFGSRAAGDVGTLTELGADHGFAVEGIELAGGPQAWSSTYVRNCLAAGDVEAAAEALGRPYTVRGTVVEGEHRGRELGYPTANVPSSGRLALPADGVYAGWLRRLDRPGDPALPAAISVGTNPTFDGREHRVESYVLDRDDLELYGVDVEVRFVARLRGMERYDSVPALLEQMADDVVRCHSILGAPTPGPS